MLRAVVNKHESTIVSLLSLAKALREGFSDSFITLRDVIFNVFPHSAIFNREELVALSRRSLSLTACRLLDAVFDAAQSKRSFGDFVTAAFLMEVFVATAEPVWRMLGRWMRDGIFMSDGISNTDHITLPQEFFIESNELVLTDADFWSDGYQLRSALLKNEGGETLEERVVVPAFLSPVADSILSAGKSVGLLRVLGKSYTFEAPHDDTLSVAAWLSFEDFIQTSTKEALLDLSRSMSTHDISLILSEGLSPACFRASEMLQAILFTDCELSYHIKVVEDVYLMRKGDLMSNFCDALFSRVSHPMVITSLSIVTKETP